MTGRLVDLALGRNRKQRVTVELDQDFETKFEELFGQELDIEIKKHRERRSLDANAYFWVLAGKLSAVLHIPPEEIYRQYIPDVGGNFEIVPTKEADLDKKARWWAAGKIGRMSEDMGPCRDLPGYHNVRRFIGSSEYDSAQMSRLIDLIIWDCKENGIETLPPYKLDAMKERWGRHAP